MGTLHFVHCVDTEGPLHESLTDTFVDLRETFGIDLAPSREGLAEIQSGHGVPEAIRPAVMARYAPQRLNYNRNWGMIDRMHERLFSREFRASFTDDFGRAYRLNWFCLDHAGFEGNPRRRTLGYNLVYHYYADLCRQNPHALDRLYWHCHPVAFNREANCQGLNIQHNPAHLTSLARRVIDCGHFPAAFRPGYHQEKIDLNLFLEQWIPFDYGNLNGEDHQGRAVRDYRYIDWRDAPTEWRPYHPSFEAAGRPGTLRRWITRSLTLSTNFCALTKGELVQAFREAEQRDVLVSVNSHDNRDMVAEIDNLHALFDSARAESGSRAPVRFCNAVEGFVRTLDLPPVTPVSLTSSLSAHELRINVSGASFTFQPFFCIRTATGEYLHDNLSRGEDSGGYFYVFDWQTIPLRAVDRIGLAATSVNGDVTVVTIIPESGQTTMRVLRGMDDREFQNEGAGTK